MLRSAAYQKEAPWDARPAPLVETSGNGFRWVFCLPQARRLC
jgi:hypothetical protein